MNEKERASMERAIREMQLQVVALAQQLQGMLITVRLVQTQEREESSDDEFEGGIVNTARPK